VYVCMCVCVYVCMYACMCACVYVYVFMCVYVCTYVCMYVCTYEHLELGMQNFCVGMKQKPNYKFYMKTIYMLTIRNMATVRQ